MKRTEVENKDKSKKKIQSTCKNCGHFLVKDGKRGFVWRHSQEAQSTKGLMCLVGFGSKEGACSCVDPVPVGVKE